MKYEGPSTPFTCGANGIAWTEHAPKLILIARKNASNCANPSKPFNHRFPTLDSQFDVNHSFPAYSGEQLKKLHGS